MIKRDAMRRMAAGIAIAVAVAWTGFAETVTNVRGMQRENSHLVDIYYDLEAPDGDTYTVGVEIEGKTLTVNASTFTGDVGEGVTPGTNRHIIWDAGTDWPGNRGEVKAVVTATKKDPTVSHGKVQLWEGGPYWADRNIGASVPEDYGLYFWWGDTVGHRPSGTTFDFNFAYDDAVSGQTCDKNIDTLLSEGWIVSKDGTYVLAPAHDAAQVQWGGGWRMPTKQELDDLNNKCDWNWTTMNGVNGYVVRGRDGYASNSIFLPCAGFGLGTSLVHAGSYGYFWSSVPDSDFSSYAWNLSFYSSYLGADGIYDRRIGQSVRPVQGFTK